jgi:hypothetical protein
MSIDVIFCPHVLLSLIMEKMHEMLSCRLHLAQIISNFNTVSPLLILSEVCYLAETGTRKKNWFIHAQKKS